MTWAMRPVGEDKGMSLARSLIVARGESLGCVVEAASLVGGVRGVASVTLTA